MAGKAGDALHVHMSATVVMVTMVMVIMVVTVVMVVLVDAGLQPTSSAITGGADDLCINNTKYKDRTN